MAVLVVDEVAVAFVLPLVVPLYMELVEFEDVDWIKVMVLAGA